MTKESLLPMERYDFAENFEIKEVKGKKMIALNGYFYTGSTSALHVSSGTDKQQRRTKYHDSCSEISKMEKSRSK